MNHTVILVHLSRPWDGFHRRHMLMALASSLPPGVLMICVDRPVTFDVTPLRNPRRFLRHIWRAKCQDVSENLKVVILRTFLHDIVLSHTPWMSRTNAWLISLQLKKILRTLAPEGVRVIQWIYHPIQAWVRLAFPGAPLIYECYDEHWYTPDGKLLPKMRTLETELLGVADVTFVTTNTLLEKRRDLTKTICLLPNGIPDFFLDEPTPIADPIDNIPHPRIAYIGVIRRPMNLQLLHNVFEQHPDWQLILVGPVQRNLEIELVADLPNVHLVGERLFESLPAIMRKLDVGLIPHEVNEFTRVMSPLKLMEYLSAGLPVVSTRLPELVRAGQFTIFAEDDPASFASAVEDAIGRDRLRFRQEAHKYARQFTWKAIATRDVLPAIRELLADDST